MKSMLIAVGLLLAVFAMTANAQAADNVIAVNMDQVFVESNLVKHRSKQMRDTVKEVQDKINAMDEELKVLETELGIRAPTHPRYDDFREQLEVAKLRRDLYRDRQSKRINKMEMELLLQSYQDMQQLVSEFGKEHKIDFVLLLSEGDFQSSSVQTLRLLIGQRSIIYVNPEKNFTQKFIEFANSRFRGQEDDAPAPTTGAP